MTRYCKKGGWGGVRARAGRKTLSKLDRILIVSRFQNEWKKCCAKADKLRTPNRIRANWIKLERVPLQQRALVLSLVDQEEMPRGLPAVVRSAVIALKKNRETLDRAGRVRPQARPYGKRDALLRRIAAAESNRRGISISSRRLRRWCDEYQNLISG
jgi:hypothetical protein